MRLLDALKIIQSAGPATPAYPVFLACGFTPLHLQTFLAASLQQLLPMRRVTVASGIFGDLTGNAGRITGANPQLGVVVAEWPDFDPRLGIRRISGWDWSVLPEIVVETRRAASALEQALTDAATHTPVIVSLPSLPVLPLSSGHPQAVSAFQAELEAIIADLKFRLSRLPNISVIHPPAVTADSADPVSEIASGFPYSLAHAAELSRRIAGAAGLQPNRKGIITDLDMTVWKGIVGDDGIDGVFWDMEHQAQSYAIYQQMLHAFAKEGVLVAAASKNSPHVVEKIFAERGDLILKHADLFPLAASWQPKSELVAGILAAWNIGPDAVTFIDDNPFELEEVSRRFPAIECVRFDPSPRQVMALWSDLRAKYARRSISQEDQIRSASLRSAAQIEALSGESASADDFLARLQATLDLQLSRNAEDLRALELLNKTNQFNLNGARYTNSEFLNYLKQEGSFLLTVTYHDKFGPLGKICAGLGRILKGNVRLDAWVLSCRAFSRCIEFACIDALFHELNCRTITLNARKTERNGPFMEFLAQIAGSPPHAGDVTIDRETFGDHCPALPHTRNRHIAEELVSPV